jgi:hypothetical protein
VSHHQWYLKSGKKQKSEHAEPFQAGTGALSKWIFKSELLA